MREILFRGKGFDGEWYEGSLLIETHEKPSETSVCYLIKNTTYGYDSDYAFDNTYMSGCEAAVIPDTIGQYTGFTDKNGKRIFEGDIVDVEYDIQYVGVAADRIGLFVVVFDDGSFMKQKNDGGLFHFIPSDKCEVVGNIHDNPELLKGE